MWDFAEETVGVGENNVPHEFSTYTDFTTHTDRGYSAANQP